MLPQNSNERPSHQPIPTPLLYHAWQAAGRSVGSGDRREISGSMLAPPPSLTWTSSFNDASLRSIGQECLGLKERAGYH